jgi:hypothetical protein
MGNACCRTVVVPIAPPSEIVIFKEGLWNESQLTHLADGVWEHVPMCVSLHRNSPLAQHHNLCTSWTKLKEIIVDWQKVTPPRPLVVAIYGPWVNPRTALDHIALTYIFDSLWKWLNEHFEYTIHIAIDATFAPQWIYNAHPIRFLPQ